MAVFHGWRGLGLTESRTSDDEAKKPIIEANEISNSSTGGGDCGAPDVLEDTPLAAFYAAEQEWVVYMNTNKRLAVYSISESARQFPLLDP